MKRLKEMADQGLLRAKIIPVGILGRVSYMKAIWIAAHDKPVDAWFSSTTTRLQKSDLTPAGENLIISNNKLFMEGWKATGVPLTVFKSSDEQVRIYHGLAQAPQNAELDPLHQLIREATNGSQAIGFQT